ncbi:MAG: SurA N-terminal domain-containing protein, partial [Candidatus Bipolaricaulota bacterium]
MVRRFFDRYKVIIVWIMVIGFFLGAAGLAAFQYMRPSSSRDSATGGEDQSVAIKVDGNSISENQFDQAYENAIRQQEQVYSQYDRDFSKMLEGAKGALQKLRIKASVAESLIQNELMRQEAETRGIEPSQEKVNQQFNQQVDQLLEERDWTREDLENALASQDLSYSDFEKESKENIRQNLQTEELQNQIIGDVDPSDSELETFFQDNLSDYAQTPSQVKASHVVLESQTQANQILEKVEGGTSFQALAEEE